VGLVGVEIVDRRPRDEESLQFENWSKETEFELGAGEKDEKQCNLEMKVKAGKESTFFISTSFLW